MQGCEKCLPNCICHKAMLHVYEYVWVRELRSAAEQVLFRRHDAELVEDRPLRQFGTSSQVARASSEEMES